MSKLNNRGSSSCICYKGSVNINIVRDRQVIKSIKAHNEGTNELFRFICNALINVNNPTKCPTYVKGGYMGDGYTEMFNEPMFVSDTDIEETNDNCSAVLKFIVPSTYIDFNGGLNINTLKLYNQSNVFSNDGVECASITLASPIGQAELPQGTSLVIVWKLTLSNEEVS